MSDATCDRMTIPAAPSAAPAPFGFLRAAFHSWLQREQERGDLARLDERDLHDLGVTRGDLEFRLNRPFWQG